MILNYLSSIYYSGQLSFCGWILTEKFLDPGEKEFRFTVTLYNEIKYCLFRSYICDKQFELLLIRKYIRECPIWNEKRRENLFADGRKIESEES